MEGQVRVALVTSKRDSLDQIKRYMPANFYAVQVDEEIFIIGRDRAGWTMEDYILPRLASGLIWAEALV